MVDVEGAVHCFDAKTGKVHWRSEGKSQTYGSPLIADGHLYVGNDDGELNLFKLSADAAAAEPVRQYEFDSPLYAPPIAVGGTLFLRDCNALFAIGR
jgi:outer membrane protein assembly factor BamB